MSKINIHKMIFQIQMRNPLYLDKTGAFIKATSELLDNWEGGIQGFKFVHINKRFSGRITPYDFAMSSERISTLDEFEHCTIQTITPIPDIYESPKLIRTGFRTFSMLRCTSSEAFEIIRKFFISDLESIITPDGTLDGIETTFRFNLGKSFFTNLRFYYGRRTVIDEQTFRERSESGLIIDIDFYHKADNETLLTHNYVTQQIKPFFEKAKSVIKQIKNNVHKAVNLHA